MFCRFPYFLSPVLPSLVFYSFWFLWAFNINHALAWTRISHILLIPNPFNLLGQLLFPDFHMLLENTTWNLSTTLKTLLFYGGLPYLINTLVSQLNDCSLNILFSIYHPRLRFSPSICFILFCTCNLFYVQSLSRQLPNKTIKIIDP